MNNKKGFTLIELLVVIAIIGILSSVVLASLNSARESSEDARIKANLTNFRAQAALYYAENDSFHIDDNSNACVDDNNASFYDDFTNNDCASIPEGWAANAQLSDETYFCVDYTGASTNTGTTDSIDSTASPEDVECKI